MVALFQGFLNLRRKYPLFGGIQLLCGQMADKRGE
jgi:hypothetical protein